MKTVEQLIADELKRKAYRDLYNQRPEVKAKRAEYMKTRNAEQRAVFAAFKAGKLNFGPAGTRVDMSSGQVVDEPFADVQ